MQLVCKLLLNVEHVCELYLKRGNRVNEFLLLRISMVGLGWFGLVWLGLIGLVWFSSGKEGRGICFMDLQVHHHMHFFRFLCI
jgi:hypothetical protein